MNLIEKLGLEKCKQIVDGAPDQTASYYMYDTYFKSQNPVEWFYWEENQWKFTSYSKRFENFLISLKDLRTALADHDSKPCSHGYDIACLICGFGTEDGVRVWRKQIETDNVTDIRNHISPNTKVIEHESNKNTV